MTRNATLYEEEKMAAKTMRLLFAGLFVMLACGLSRADDLGFQPKKSEIHVSSEVPRITAYEAKKLFDEGKLILANAHEREGYNKGHIVGSISLPNGEVQNMDIELPRDKIIAFYCT